MRKCNVLLGRLVIIDFEGESAGDFDRTGREESFAYVAGAEVDTEGRLIDLFYLPCDAERIAKALKDDPLFEEPVHLSVHSLDGKEIDQKLYEFDGTLYDALLIAANEGKKYDV